MATPGIQSQLPIVWLLTDQLVPVDFVVMSAKFAIKPQQINLARNARGAVFNTATAAFLNDFGEGVPTLEISGNTGFGSEFGTGFADFKALEGLFITYLNLRQNSLAPNNITLTYFDTINVEAFNVYPMRFTLQRTARSPQLYYYSISLVVLTDLLETAIFKLTNPIFNGTTTQSVINGLSTSLQSIANSFANILPAF